MVVLFGRERAIPKTAITLCDMKRRNSKRCRQISYRDRSDQIKVSVEIAVYGFINQRFRPPDTHETASNHQ